MANPLRLLVTGLAAFVLTMTLANAQAPPRPSPAGDGQRFQQALTVMEVERDYLAAARAFEALAGGPDRSLASRALVYAGVCYERLGRTEAERLYQRVLSDFADQPSAVREARDRLQALTRPARAAGPPMVTLRQAWPDRPAGATGFGSASADTRVIVTPLEGDDGSVGLVDTATGRLLPTRFVLNAVAQGRTRPCLSTIPFVVSVDRKELAYACEIDGSRHELRIAKVDGSTRLLRRTDPGESVNVSQWTSRGDLAAILTDQTRGSRFVLIAARDGREQPGFVLPAIPRTLSVSPDGRWVAYDGPSSGSNDDDVYVAALPDGPASVLLRGPANDVHPLWTPDGGRLLFVSDRTGTSGLWTVAVRDGRAVESPIVLQQDIGRVVNPFGITHDGAYLYFRQLGFPDVYSVALDPRGVAQGTPVALSRAYAGSNMHATWAPDGSRVAFVAQLGYGSRQTIAIRDVRSETQRSVETTFVWIFRMRWSPDGRLLLVKGRDSAGRYGLHTVDLESGSALLIRGFAPNAETDLGEAEWANENARVIYEISSSGADARAQLHELDIQSRIDRVIFTVPERTWLARGPGFSVSRETGALALALFHDPSGGGNATGSDVVVRAPDGSMRTVLTTTAPDLVYGVGWLDRQYLLVVRPDPAVNRALRVWRVDTTSGDANDLGISVQGLRDIQVDPNGPAVAFTAGSYSRHVWVLEHFKPPATPPGASAGPRQRVP